MSLIPSFFDEFYRNRPTRLLDQHFGMALTPEDLLEPILPREIRRMLYDPFGYIRPWRTVASERDFGSTVTWDKDKFQVNLDVQQFAPEEVNVKVTGDNEICVEGKHEERRDDHGFVSRQFVRKYYLPKGHDTQRSESKLSSDGVLTITAPKVEGEGIEEHRIIPSQQTGQPSKAIEQKSKI